LGGSLGCSTEFSFLNPVLDTKTKPTAREWVLALGLCRISMAKLAYELEKGLMDATTKAAIFASLVVQKAVVSIEGPFFRGCFGRGKATDFHVSLLS
jgi:hypothetical protein